MTRDQIIAKWETLTTRERNAWVAEVVFGMTIGRDEKGPYVCGYGTVAYELDAYTTDITAAWSVLEEMRKGFFVALIDNFYGWHVDIEGVYAIGDEAAETICLASILRKLTPREDDDAQDSGEHTSDRFGRCALCMRRSRSVPM